VTVTKKKVVATTRRRRREASATVGPYRVVARVAEAMASLA
jgi:hypothetical protein